MFPYNVRNTNAKLGFTLTELIVILLVVSLLAVVGIPNFLGMFQRFQANSDFDQVLGAIKEAQLQAIRLSKTCTLRIDETASNKIAIDDPIADQGCLINPVILPTSTRIKTNNDGSIVSFTFQGKTNMMQTIIVSDGEDYNNRCLVISNGIGMVRSGLYKKSFDDEPDPTECQNQ